MGSRGDLRSRESRISLTMPLQRLSKDFIPCSGRCLGHGAMELAQSFMIPKSCGALVMAEISEYLSRMKDLQARRGYTDAEMRRDFSSVRDWLHQLLDGAGEGEGFRTYARLCFDVKPSRVMIRLEEDGEYQPVLILTHRKLGHKMLQLSEIGDIISTTDAAGNDVRPKWWWGRTDRAKAFNPDMLSGYMHQ
jgi:hypothetical protein